MSLLEDLAAVEGELERQERDVTIAQEAAELAADFRSFVRGAWHLLEPDRWVDGRRQSTFRSSWHIDAICDHLESARAGNTRRLVLNLPPRHMKSLLVSVFWPVWRWTFEPELRFLTFSYDQDLANRDATKSRDVIRSEWYRQRWPHVRLKGDVNRVSRYENTLTGHRIAEHVGGGTGEGGDVIVIDDPHQAERVLSDVQRAKDLRWHSNTVSSRFNDPTKGVQVIVMQRLHEHDLTGHVLAQEGWTHLCLPARFDPRHPFTWPDDPRSQPGELLWPEHVPETELNSLQSGMTARDIAGQFQQLPAPLEGDLLKVKDWRYYNRELSFYAERRRFDTEAVAELASAVGRFRFIVHSWDTSLKDRDKSDFVAGTVWGVIEANAFMLRRSSARLGFNATVEEMRQVGEWARDLWPNVPQYIVIEAAANGPDAILELKRRLTGVVAYKAVGTKEMRAEAASPALEGHNCFLPGYALEDGSGYDPRTPASVQEFVEACAKFPASSHDDDVDSWSMAMNYIRTRGTGTGRTFVPRGRIE